MTDDNQLLERFATGGDEDAFRELIERHLDLVYSAALRRVNGDASLAEDVAQTVFIDLARKAGSLQRDVVLTGWLYEAARFAAANAIRGERRRQHREQEAMTMQQLASDSTPRWEQLAPVLDDAMGDLCAADRNAILLRYFKNQDFQTVGLALGVSDTAARKRVSRAVEHLRDFFGKRGVTVGASGLIVIISANAVQSAPVGLAGTISTATALGGTTLTTTATTTATKAIAMTTLQKTLAVAALITAVSLGVLLPSIGLFWPSRPARAANSQAALGWVQLGNEVTPRGLVPANQQHDGVTEPTLIGGIECHSLQRYPNGIELWAYFRIDPALKNQLTNLCIIEVEYFDADAGAHFHLDYDSYDEAGKLRGAYTQSKERVYLKGTQRWRKARFLFDDARFEGRQNDQADFRVAVLGPRFFLRSVKLFQE